MVHKILNEKHFNMTRILVTDDDHRLRELLGQYLAQEGYEVEMAENADQAREKLAQDVPFSVLVEDPEFLVIDKPAGLVVHPGSGNKDRTLVNSVAYHIPLTA